MNYHRSLGIYALEISPVDRMTEEAPFLLNDFPFHSITGTHRLWCFFPVVGKEFWGEDRIDQGFFSDGGLSYLVVGFEEFVNHAVQSSGYRIRNQTLV